MYPPGVLEQREKEVNDHLRKALIFAVLGVIFCGLIMGLLAFRHARQATQIIDKYGVLTERRPMATGLKVVGIFDAFIFMIAALMKDYS